MIILSSTVFNKSLPLFSAALASLAVIFLGLLFRTQLALPIISFQCFYLWLVLGTLKYKISGFLGFIAKTQIKDRLGKTNRIFMERRILLCL